MKLTVALGVMVAVLLGLVIWLSSASYGSARQPGCAVLHVAASPVSPAYPLTVCGTHLSGRWRCEGYTLRAGPALACRRPRGKGRRRVMPAAGNA